MAVDKTDMEKILSTGVDIKNRKIYFGDILDGEDGNQFTWASVEIVTRAFQYLSLLNKKPIELHMSSPGGHAYEMLRLYDVIQQCPCQVKFFGSGMICSSASYVMAGCDERYLTPNSVVMVHKGIVGELDGNFVDAMIESQECHRLDRQCSEIYAANSRMPFDFWDEFTKRDIWLTPEETITLGLADQILIPKKRGNLRRVRIAAMNKKIDKKDMAKLIRKIAKTTQHSKSIKIEIEIPKEEFDQSIIVETDEAVSVNSSKSTLDILDNVNKQSS